MFNPNYEIRNIAGYLFFKKAYRKIFQKEFDLFNRMLDIQSSFQNETQSEEQHISLLIRVDDYPHWDIKSDKYKYFHELLHNYQLPYTLGGDTVLIKGYFDPNNSSTRELNSKEIDFLEKIKKDGINISLHGLSHRVNQSGRGEYIGLSEQELNDNIDKALKKLKEYKIVPSSIIPPFNTFDDKAFKVFCKFFDTIYGGPESIYFFGGYFGPSIINEKIYIPSYWNVYGESKIIAEYIQNRLIKLNRYKKYIVPITLHWSDEYKDKFHGLKKFCEVIKSLKLKRKIRVVTDLRN